jgi:hypothetical protein
VTQSIFPSLDERLAQVFDSLTERKMPVHAAAVRDARAELARLKDDLDLSHRNRTKESVHYANLCAEIIEATGVESKGPTTAIAAVTALKDELARLRPVVEAARRWQAVLRERHVASCADPECVGCALIAAVDALRAAERDAKP